MSAEVSRPESPEDFNEVPKSEKNTPISDNFGDNYCVSPKSPKFGDAPNVEPKSRVCGSETGDHKGDIPLKDLKNEMDEAPQNVPGST